MQQKKPPRKYIQVSAYDAEAYDKHGKNMILHYVDVNGMTDEQIAAAIKKIKEDQKLKNAAYRISNPVDKSKSGRRKVKKVPTSLEEPTKEPTKEPTSIPASGNMDSKVLKGLSSKLQFDMETGNTFCLFGASKSGKTTLMMEIYRKMFPRYCKLSKLLTTIFAMNIQLPIYQDKYIIQCPYFTPDVAKYVDWQRRLNKLNNNEYKFLNMFDDFIDVRHKDIINNLILTYRNSNISSIICLQYVNLLSKAARSNINNVFLLHMNTDESIEVAVKSYLSGMLRKNGITAENAVNWYREHTIDHNYIYIHPISGCVYLSKTGATIQL